MPSFYRDATTFVWNGSSYRGTGAIRDFLQSLPGTRHELLAVDCQPIGTQAPGGGVMLALSVQGKVSYNSAAARFFTQSFVLAQDGVEGAFYILADVFRFQ